MYERNLYDWEKIESLVKMLVEKIQATGLHFNSISTITRGGLVPSRLLSDRLDISKILVDKKHIPHDSLVVDDIFDTGKTFERVLSKAKVPDEIVYATLFARKGKQFPKQLIFAQLTKNNESVVFPWDRFEHGFT